MTTTIQSDSWKYAIYKISTKNLFLLSNALSQRHQCQEKEGPEAGI